MADLTPETMPQAGVVYSSAETRPGTELRVTVAPFRDGLKVHVREWWLPPGAAEYVPTGRGIAFDPRHAASVMRGMELARQDLQAGGWE